MVWKNLYELKEHPHRNLVPEMRSLEFAELKRDIQEHGILQPIEIKYDGTILDGHHRYEIAKELGIKQVECRIVELIDIDEDMYLINTALLRRHLSEDQRAVLAYSYAELLSKARQKERAEKAINTRWKKQEYLSDTLTEKYKSTEEPETPKADTRAEYSKKYDIPERKLKYIKEIKEVKPEAMPQILKGEKKIIDVKREIEREKPKPAPVFNGTYQVIYADPPWSYDFAVDSDRDIDSKYATMKLGDIMNMKIPAADNSILFLWAPSPKLKEGLSVMEEWEFKCRTQMVWLKDRIGMGYYARQQHENLLIGVKGEGIGVPDPQNRPSSVISAPRTEHSKKPEIFYEIIEKMYPKATRIELFARNRRNGWTSWGNELPENKASNLTQTEEREQKGKLYLLRNKAI